MMITFKVPSIACDACARTISKAIQNRQPDAQVSVDVGQKIVTVETTTSENDIKQAIEGVGHTIES